MGNEIVRSPVDSLGEFLKANKGKVVSALNDAIDFERFAAVAMNTLRRTPELAQCSPASVITAVNRCAELGLEPGGPLGHAYLVPFKGECTLIIGYKGYLHLMFRSGGLKDAQAHVVYENDKFIGNFGSEPRIEHAINFGKRGKPIGAYCVLRFANGGVHITAMGLEDIERRRSVSKAKNSPMWVEWWDEGACKTVVRHGAKFGPTGERYELMAKAAEYDEDTIDSTVTPAPTQTTHSLVSENGVTQTLDATDKVKASIPNEA